jgi:serine/threonine-protein kinase HipA
MAVSGKNRHYGLRDIQRRHFNAMALRCSYGPDAEPIIQRLIAQTPAVIERVSAELPERFPAKVADRIFEGLRKTVAALEAMPLKLAS